MEITRKCGHKEAVEIAEAQRQAAEGRKCFHCWRRAALAAAPALTEPDDPYHKLGHSPVLLANKARDAFALMYGRNLRPRAEAAGAEPMRITNEAFKVVMGHDTEWWLRNAKQSAADLLRREAARDE